MSVRSGSRARRAPRLLTAVLGIMSAAAILSALAIALLSASASAGATAPQAAYPQAAYPPPGPCAAPAQGGVAPGCSTPEDTAGTSPSAPDTAASPAGSVGSSQTPSSTAIASARAEAGNPPTVNLEVLAAIFAGLLVVLGGAAMAILTKRAP